MIHELKVHPPFFQQIYDGLKTWELRKDDRVPRFEVGDELYLREFDPERAVFTERSMITAVPYVARGLERFGLPSDHCIMSVQYLGSSMEEEEIRNQNEGERLDCHFNNGDFA